MKKIRRAKKVLIIIYLTFTFLPAMPQQRSGYQLLSEITMIIEKDYPGYFILTKKQRTEYKKHKEQILRQAKKANEFEVNILANEYLHFFNDGHLNSIFFKNDYSEINEINIYPEKQKTKLSLAGLWVIKNFDLVLNIKKIKEVNCGFIHADLNGFNKTGGKHLVVYPAAGINKYNFLFLDDGGYSFTRLVTYKNGKFYESPSKVLMERINLSGVKKLKPIFTPDQSPSVRKTGNDFFEIKIPSLSFEYANQIDSILKLHHNDIIKSNTLIIDLRGNGGGSVLPTLGLIKYIKTGPIHYINSFSVASDSLISSVKNSCLERQGQYREFYENYCKKFLPNLIAHKGNMVFDSSEMYNSNEPGTPSPKNVAIIIDDLTASSAELFVLAAQQSKKVKIFGENSSGSVDFGGVITYFLTNPAHALYLTTEMAEYIRKKRYDGVGINPDILLSVRKDNWIKEVIKFYEKK